MAEHDRGESLIDKVKNAFGMGDDDHREEDAETERPPDTGEVSAGGATQGSGWEGGAGGMGASGAMGGAGASGPVGATDPRDTGAPDEAGDPGTVRTEYEMGNELDPDHETRAESGYSANTRGEAASGESPFDEGDETLRR